MRLKLIRYIPPSKKASLKDKEDLINFIKKLHLKDLFFETKIYASASGIYMDHKMLVEIAEKIISSDLNEVFIPENYNALAILAGWLVEYLYEVLINRIGPLNSARIIAKYTDTSLYLRPELIKDDYFSKFNLNPREIKSLLKKSKEKLQKIKKKKKHQAMKYSFDPKSEKIGLMISLLQKIYESKDSNKSLL